MKNWSYKIVEFEGKGFFGGLIDAEDIERRLNELGSQGWEIASAITTNEGYGTTKKIVYTLKKCNEV